MTATELLEDINNCLLFHESYGEIWISAIEHRIDKQNIDITKLKWHEVIDLVNRSILYWVGTHSNANKLYREANAILVTPERRKYINYYLDDLREFAKKGLLTTEHAYAIAI